jgi:purine-nucleoside phosphorylase
MGDDVNHTRLGALEAAEYIKRQMGLLPRVAVFTGTGLGEITDHMEIQSQLAYERIPHFPRSTVETHHGQLLAGTMGPLQLLVLQGRFHLYEGYSARAVTFPIRVLQELGIETLILTNASGGLNPAYTAGDIMAIEDHINLTGTNPLIGANEDLWGPRFPEMTAAYDAALGDLARRHANALGVRVQRGVYAGLAGPSLETPAEMRYLRTIGADAVGFSTVLETIAAVHAGMKVMGLSIITNMNLPDNLQPSSVAAIIAQAQVAAP